MSRYLNLICDAVLPGSLVLLYHRVDEPGCDPQLLSVSPKHFEEHLSILRRNWYPMSLAQLTDAGTRGRAPKRALAVTFDDGYRDNLMNAKPLLDAHEIRATVFATTGPGEAGKGYWWDRLAAAILSENEGGAGGSVTVEGKSYSWRCPRGCACAHNSWNVMREPTCSAQAAYLDLCRSVRNLAQPDQEEIVAGIERQASIGPGGARRVPAVCSPADLQALAAGGLIEIGGHTVNHLRLGAVSEELQAAEVRGCRARLSEILGCPPRSFSYPFGARTDYSRATVNFVRDAGFSYACGNYEGHVRRWTSPLELPRYLVRDWDGDTFARHLENWGRGALKKCGFSK